MRSEEAGRDHNEDNCCMIPILSSGKQEFNPETEFTLDKKGALLVVCDGMGGMNAGEVASARAVTTIAEWFSPGALTEDKMSNPEAIRRHITQAIVDADSRIKKEGKSDKSKEGMGSTIVLSWVTGEQMYIGWCGDSRAYRFNPVDGLKRLSRDHSYVQELVDAGSLSEDLAFDHPHSNIITRSLGDVNSVARPEIREYSLRNGDIIMLCSDGLCGVLRDHEIESVMQANTRSIRACRDALWEAARNAGWHDNVTIELCQIVSGCSQNAVAAPPDATETQEPQKPGDLCTAHVKKSKRSLYIGIAALFAGLVGGYFLSNYLPANPANPEKTEKKKELKYTINKKDTTCIEVSVVSSDTITLTQLLDSIKQDKDFIKKINLELEWDKDGILNCNKKGIVENGKIKPGTTVIKIPVKKKKPEAGNGNRKLDTNGGNATGGGVETQITRAREYTFETKDGMTYIKVEVFSSDITVRQVIEAAKSYIAVSDSLETDTGKLIASNVSNVRIEEGSGKITHNTSSYEIIAPSPKIMLKIPVYKKRQ